MEIPKIRQKFRDFRRIGYSANNYMALFCYLHIVFDHAIRTMRFIAQFMKWNEIYEF